MHLKKEKNVEKRNWVLFIFLPFLLNKNIIYIYTYFFSAWNGECILMTCLFTCNWNEHESEWIKFGVCWIWNQDLESEYVVYLGSSNQSQNHCQSHSSVYLELESESVIVNLLIYPLS